MKENPLELQRWFLPDLRGLNMISSDWPIVIV